MQRFNRIAAKSEEIVRQTDSVYAQHGLPDGGKRLLRRSSGSDVFHLCLYASFRLGQRLAVYLAVRR